MNSPLLSFIIPCYNGEPFIKLCIDSIIEQNLDNYEIICINDGSKDKSKKILDDLALKDSRIKVIHKKNEGAAKARTIGIERANGEYIMFIDVDDTLVSNSIGRMLESIVTNQGDIIVSGFNIVKGKKIIKKMPVRFKHIDNITYLKKILTGKSGWELCGKIFKKELFANISTPENIRMVEDGAVFIQVVCNSSIILGYEQPIYNYIQHQSSATHTRSKEYAEETLKAGIFIEKYLYKQQFYNKLRKEIDSFFLLLYSTSTRRYYLQRNNPLVQLIRKKHYKIKSLSLIPIKKAIYVFSLISLRTDLIFQYILKERTL